MWVQLVFLYLWFFLLFITTVSGQHMFYRFVLRGFNALCCVYAFSMLLLTLFWSYLSLYRGTWDIWSLSSLYNDTRYVWGMFEKRTRVRQAGSGSGDVTSIGIGRAGVLSTMWLSLGDLKREGNLIFIILFYHTTRSKTTGQ